MSSVTNEILLFTDESELEKYAPGGGKNATRVHWGQLKLILSDISFLNYFWNPDQVPNPTFVSVGAAPGHHYPILVKMFPQINFVFYDPRPFSFTEEDLAEFADRVDIRVQLFTDDDAREWAGRNDVLFTSDIRSINNEDLKKRGLTDEQISRELEKAVDDDMKLQQGWIEIVDPVAAMLKFRLPYVDDDQDIKYEYLDGYLLKQQWAPLSSTEVRLVPVKKDGSYVKRVWSSEKHQDKCYFFNTSIREGAEYKNVFSGLDEPYEGDLTNRYDDTATVVILKSYLEKMTGEDAVQSDVMALYQVIVDAINAHRKFPVTLSILRSSKVKSTVKRGFNKASTRASTARTPDAKVPAASSSRTQKSVETAVPVPAVPAATSRRRTATTARRVSRVANK